MNTKEDTPKDETIDGGHNALQISTLSTAAAAETLEQCRLLEGI